MQQLYAQVKKVGIHFLFMFWTVWKPLNGYNFENTATSIFYSARNTASIHKNNLGQPVLPRLQKNPNTASVTGEDPASGLPTLQTVNYKNIANHHIANHQNEGFTPQPRRIQKENKNAVNL